MMVGDLGMFGGEGVALSEDLIYFQTGTQIQPGLPIVSKSGPNRQI